MRLEPRLFVYITADITDKFPDEDWDDDDSILECCIEHMRPDDVLDGAKWCLRREPEWRSVGADAARLGS